MHKNKSSRIRPIFRCTAMMVQMVGVKVCAGVGVLVTLKKISNDENVNYEEGKGFLQGW